MALDLELSADSLSIIFNLLQYQSVSLGQLRVNEDEVLEQLLWLAHMLLAKSAPIIAFCYFTTAFAGRFEQFKALLRGGHSWIFRRQLKFASIVIGARIFS